MSWSAVSFGLALWASQAAPPQAKPEVIKLSNAPRIAAPPSLGEDWRESILTLWDGGKPVGSALLIDGSGLYVANRRVIRNRELGAVDADGRSVELKVVGSDRITELVLLSAVDYRNENARVFTTTANRELGPVYGLVGDHIFSADLVSVSRMGADTRIGRVIPLSEVRMDSTQRNVEDAIFVQGPYLLGTVLHIQENAISPEATEQMNVQSLNNGRPYFGPGFLKVVYITGADLVRRVMAGFQSPDRQVTYPYIGAFCRDAVGGGAEVVAVPQDSPAYQAGLRPGDIITNMAGAPIRRSIEYGKLLWRINPGDRVQINFVRRLVQGKVTVTVKELAN